MFDIADKEKLIDTIVADAGYPNVSLSIGNYTDFDEIRQSIETAISEHTKSMVRSIINHLYTNREFEEDIGLTT